MNYKCWKKGGHSLDKGWDFRLMCAGNKPSSCALAGTDAGAGAGGLTTCYNAAVTAGAGYFAWQADAAGGADSCLTGGTAGDPCAAGITANTGTGGSGSDYNYYRLEHNAVLACE